MTAAALPMRIVQPDRRARAAWLRRWLDPKARDVLGYELSDQGGYMVALAVRAMEREG